VRVRILLIVAALAALLVGVPPSARPGLAQAVQAIAAVVNDEIVSTRALTDRLRLVLATSNLPDDPETRRRVEQQVLRVLIDETLQRQEARRLDLRVTAEEVDNALRSIAERNNLTVEQLAQELARAQVPMATLRDQITAQIAWLKVIARRIRPQVVVTEAQIDVALRTAPAATGDRELLLSEILLPVYDPEQEPAVLEDAQRLVAAIRQGADFAALAREVSAAPSAESGGDLGWIATTALAEPLRAALAGTEPGQLSPPIQTPNGVQIFLVRDARRRTGAPSPAAPIDDPAARQAARERLVEEQTQRLANRYLRSLRLEAFIDVRL
jgi:peptidyl-prolyl cis-trans isomerase SurA